MKLIDKEKLLKDLKQKRYSKRSLELIESQPEIEAIPIEWMEKWEIDHEHELYFRSERPKYIIQRLINEWEKENEKSV